MLATLAIRRSISIPRWRRLPGTVNQRPSRAFSRRIPALKLEARQISAGSSTQTRDQSTAAVRKIPSFAVRSVREFACGRGIVVSPLYSLTGWLADIR
ncbi:hypothetical protein BDN71DRAFT_1445195 [Pleurotus eryngii]|uniref:Uncharacterized protein n=1 Tax=Pleurotus eryngii TaxID=5323 RepID=A0A9P6DGU4_PLEER|nr:hypothetical protein BDN71DRAFT_1445195 [Pleurotus eryngii]